MTYLIDKSDKTYIYDEIHRDDRIDRIARYVGTCGRCGRAICLGD